MSCSILGLRLSVAIILVAILGLPTLSVSGQDGANKPVREPVFRVVANRDTRPDAQPNATPHPLDPALEIAHRGLANIQSNVHDYTCYMVKRERINGRLADPQTMFVKVRNERVRNGERVPFSIYMRFVRPQDINGREVIWVDGRNGDKMVAHEAGWKGFITAKLDPDGRMAMNGQRYPIYEAGVENLTVKLIEKAERDRQHGECRVEFFQGATVNKRQCTMIQVTHPEQRGPFDFYIAKVYIDDELNIPIRYVAYSWPRTQGGEPVLEEEYTYLNVKVNVGLSDRDFDPNNPEYDFP